MNIYRTVILCIVLYWFETWSLILRQEYRLSLYANTVLRKVFCPKTEKVTRGWRKLHNVGIHDLYTGPNIITVKESEMDGTCSMGEMRNRILFGKPKGKKQLC
jgi:hypothetical protein